MRLTPWIWRPFARCLAVSMLLGLSAPMAGGKPADVISPDLSAQALVAGMRTGWNLGNTFDAAASPGSSLTGDIAEIETLWLGGPTYQTQRSLIRAVRAAGFDVLRVPVTWQKVADPDNNWEIRQDWLERVATVVDWALEEGMFVILNAHHENNNLGLGEAGADQESHPGNEYITRIWHQVAVAFRDRGERLVFEGLNEPRHEGGEHEWVGGTQMVRDNLNHLNQRFVDVVRATGGNNAHRILQVPTVAAGPSPAAMRDFVVPADPMNPGVNKIIWSLHTYSPFNWAHDGKGSYPGLALITEALDEVAKNAKRLGIPVVLGEWGSTRASVGPDRDEELRNRQRPIHAEDYVRAAAERGMPAVWWDNAGFGGGGTHSWGIIQRVQPHDISDLDREIIAAIMRGKGAFDQAR